MQTIFQTDNELDILMLKEMLEKNNIQCTIFRKNATDYLHITGANLTDDVELRVADGDVKRAKEIIESTNYSEDVKKNKPKNYSNKGKVYFARALLITMVLILIFFLVLRIAGIVS